MSNSKEELERLKKQLREEEEKARLEAEIKEIRARLEKPKASSIVKGWLKETGYWNSFVVGVPGIVISEIGSLLMPYPLAIIGGLMIIAAIMLTPFLRPFWDSKYKPPGAKK